MFLRLKGARKCSASRSIRQMQIKASARYFLLTRMAKITTMTSVDKHIEKLDCKMMQPHWKVVWQFLKMLNTDIPYDQTVSFLATCLYLWAITKSSDWVASRTET